MSAVFLDSNVILLHLLDNHPELSPRATSFLERVEAGDVRVEVTDTVIFEVVFTLERSFHQPKAAIRDVLLQLLDLPGIALPGKRLVRAALNEYVVLNVSYADAYHAVVMRERGIKQVVSFDRHFDRFSDIERITP